MHNIAKKIMIFSLAGIIQIGFSTTMVMASPLYNESLQRITQLDDRQDGGPWQPDQHKHQRQPQRPQREQPQPPDQPQPPQPGQGGPNDPGPDQ